MAWPGAAAAIGDRHLSQLAQRSWTTSEGLPQASVTGLLQTRDGYLWIATLGGVVRFDGVRFETFSKAREAGILSDDVNGLSLAPDGTLWLSSNGGGVSSLAPGAGEFRHLEGPGSESAAAVLEDRHGTVWIGTLGDGLLRWDRGTVATLTTANGLASATVWHLLEDTRGRIWIGTAAGLDRIDEQGRLARIPGCTDGYPVRALIERRDGSVWAGTDGAGICRQDGDRMAPVAEAAEIAHEGVLALVEARNGDLWAGTRGAGLWRRHGGRWERLNLESRGLVVSILALFEDREGIVWVGTRSGGLIALLDGEVTTTSVAEGLPAAMVWSVLEDRAGALWIGTEGGGLVRQDASGIRRWTAADGLGSNSVWALAQAPDGSLWIGSRAGGLHHMRDGRLLESFSMADGLPAASVRAIKVDRRGRVWLGTDGGGLARLEGGRPVALPPELQPASPVVRVLLEDHAGALWIGTLGGGLSRLDDNGLQTFRAHDGLASDMVTALYEDGDHVLWIGSRGGGLTRLAGGRFDVISTRQGLLDDNVFAILEDGAGRLWTSSNQGLSGLDKRQVTDLLAGRIERVRPYALGVSHGMRSAECNGWAQPSGWRRRDGGLLFATVDGVVTVDPGRVGAAPAPAPVRVERVSADGAALELGRRVTVPAGSQQIEVSFAAFEFTHPDDLVFAYRLSGLNDRWVEIEGRRTVYFTTLPPGDDVLELGVRNRRSDRDWVVTSLPITVVPLLHQTAWFRALIALLVLTLLAAAYRLRVAMMRRRERELERMVHERTAALEEKRDQLAKLDRIVRSINVEIDVEHLLAALLAEMRIIRGLERAVAIVRDEEQPQIFRIVASHGWRDDSRLRELELTAAEVERRNIEGAQEILPEIFLGKRSDEAGSATGDRPRSRLVMRVPIGGEVQAYLVFSNYHDPDAFDAHDVALLSSLQAHVLSAFHKLSSLAHLRRLNEKKNELLGLAAHDLRNPLHLIASWLELTIRRLRRDHAEVEQGIADLERAQRATEHMTSLVAGIVDLSAIESGRMTLELGRADLAAILGECEEFYSSMASQKSIRLVVQRAPAPPPVWADRVRVLEVLGNLLSNAIKYTHAGGEVRISWEAGESEVAVHVRDSGQGLSRDDLESVFQSFRTLSARPTAGEASTGLGLAIVKKIVELHGGRVWAAGERGKGATFSFTLPRAA